jgi:hypothetical protein
MRPDLLADVSGQFIIEIGRQFLQNLDAVPPAVLMDRLARAGVSWNF